MTFRVIYFLIGQYRIIAVYLGEDNPELSELKAYSRNLKMVLKDCVG
jgi:hypothetical protein